MQPQNPIDPNTQPNNMPPVSGAQPQAPNNVFFQPGQAPTVQPTVQQAQPGFGQPTYQQQYTAPQPQATASEDPGKTLSIIGICLFIIPVIGISLSIVGMMKSKHSGYTGKLGQIGIAANIASIVLGVVLTVVLPLLFTKNAIDKLDLPAPSPVIQTSPLSSSVAPSTQSNAGLAVGMSKADVNKSLKMEPIGCTQLPGGKSEICTYRNGAGASDSTVVANVTFVDGKLTRASGYTDDGEKLIKVGA